MAPRPLLRWWSTHRERVGEQPSEFLVEEQNALVPQMAEQWLEVPKIIHQDRILQQTAKQIADRLEAKRDLAGAEKRLTASGKVFADEWKAQAECMRNVRGNRRAVGRVITSVERKFHGEEQLKLIVEKCAAKVEGELQKKMVIETGEIDDHCNKWTVHEGGQLVESWETRIVTLKVRQDREPIETSKEAHKVRKQGKSG